MSLKSSLINNINSFADSITNINPDILKWVGIATGVAAIVTAINDTPKAEHAIEEAKEEIAAIKDSEQDNKGKELTKAYFSAGAKIVKAYMPTILLEATSITCILASNGLVKKRTAQVIAAYNTLDSVFNKYRNRVVQEYGEKVDQHLYYGTFRDKVDVTEFDEEGNGTTSKKKVDILPEDENDLGFSRFFGPDNKNWEKIPGANALFLRGVQNWCNGRLRSQGHLFLNEVYDNLGFPRTKEGQVVGWIEGKGDDFVDFGISDIFSNRGFVDDNYVAGVLLNFNVYGIIIDQI